MELTLGEKITVARNRMKKTGPRMSQMELAKKCELSAQNIWSIENNKSNPKIGTLEKIAAALNCSVSIELIPINQSISE